MITLEIIGIRLFVDIVKIVYLFVRLNYRTTPDVHEDICHEDKHPVARIRNKHRQHYCLANSFKQNENTK